MHAACDTRARASVFILDLSLGENMSSFLMVLPRDPKLGLPGHEASEDPAEAELRKTLDELWVRGAIGVRRCVRVYTKLQTYLRCNRCRSPGCRLLC